MTRELKIALIVGFSAVLFVAILLSDHFSKARRAMVADPNAATPMLVGIAPTDPLKTPEARALEAERTLAMAEGVSPVADEMARRQAEREQRAIEGDPVVVNRMASADDAGAADSSTTPLADRVAGVLTSAADEARARLTSGTAPVALSMDTSRDPNTQLSEQMRRAVDPAAPVGEPADTSAPRQAATDPSEGPAPTSEKPVTRHMVAGGESLYDIAKRYYGSGNQWRRIAEANPGRVASNGAVRQGVQLVIPERARPSAPASSPAPRAEPKPEPVKSPGATPSSKPRLTLPSETRVAQAKPEAKKPETAKRTAGKTDSSKADGGRETRADRSSRPSTYTVRAGDTAGKISQRILGTSRRADEILELNNVEEESLRVGMVLRIPQG